MLLPRRRRGIALAGALLAGSLVAAGAARAADAPVAPPAGKVFATPEEAVQALRSAAERNDDAALVEILGPGSEDVVQTGADLMVAGERRRFAAAVKAKFSFDRSQEAEGVLVLEVGPHDLPIPIPLRRTERGWAFDAAAGREGLLARRIGLNEHETIALCRAYISAQVDYAAKDRDGDAVREFAQKLRSTPGRHDGLYWKADEAAGEEPSPLAHVVTPLRDAVTPPGDAVASPRDAVVAGTASTRRRAPFNGYYFRILKAQGPHAPGGARTYVVNGNMIAGCALIAVPAEHGSTGVKSFLVSHHGKIHEKDLGENGIATAYAMEAYDPDPSWSVVPPEREDKAVRFWEE